MKHPLWVCVCFLLFICMHFHNLVVSLFVQWWRQMCLCALLALKSRFAFDSFFNDTAHRDSVQMFWTWSEPGRAYSQLVQLTPGGDRCDVLNLACYSKPFEKERSFLFFLLELGLSFEAHCASQVFPVILLLSIPDSANTLHPLAFHPHISRKARPDFCCFRCLHGKTLLF